MKPAESAEPNGQDATPVQAGSDTRRALRVLIANHQFWRLTGSEIHAIQLAEHFKHQDAEVFLFGVSCERWLVDEIEKRGVRLIDLRTVRREAAQGFDIVWTHHETAFFLFHILLGIRCRLAVHGLLSRVAKLERVPLMPPIQRFEKLAVLANSVETRDAAQQAAGQSGIGVLLNIVPDAFRAHPKTDYSPVLRRVVVVSNHIPKEVIEAKSLLAEKGVAVELIGEGYRHVLVDHHTLIDFDVVVTIGKTAQYALVQGIPLFLYDIFGGPGYFGPAEVDRHEAHNFSGRSEPGHMRAEEISQALIDGYARSVAFARSLRASHADRYGVGSQTEQLMARMEQDRSALFGRMARLRSAAVTATRRPSVPLRLIAPRTVDALGEWIKALRR